MAWGSGRPFGSFIGNGYTTTELPLMASTTQGRSRGIIEHYLVPAFGALCLRDLTPLTLQKFISGFEMTGSEDGAPVGSEDGHSRKLLSREPVDKIRDVLSSILVAAVNQCF